MLNTSKECPNFLPGTIFSKFKKFTPPEVDADFLKYVNNVKKNLHDSISNLDSNYTISSLYLENMKNLYYYCLQIRNNYVNANNVDLSGFPEQSRESIRELLIVIENYFRNHNSIETEYYEKYMKMYIHESHYLKD